MTKNSIIFHYKFDVKNITLSFIGYLYKFQITYLCPVGEFTILTKVTKLRFNYCVTLFWNLPIKNLKSDCLICKKGHNRPLHNVN